MSGKGLTPAQQLAQQKAALAAHAAHLKLLYSQDGGVMSGQDYSQPDPYEGTDVASTAGEGGAGTPELQKIAADLMSGQITTLQAFQFVQAEAKPGGLLSDFAIVESGTNNARDTTMHDMLFDKIKGWGGEVGKANVTAQKGDGTGLPNQNDTYSADNAPMSDAVRSTRQNALKAYEGAASGMEAWDASNKAPTKLLTTDQQVGLTVNNLLKHVLNGGKKPTGFVDALGQYPADVAFNKNGGDGVDTSKMSRKEKYNFDLQAEHFGGPKAKRTDVPATKDVKQAGKDRAAYDTQRRSMRMDLNKKANDVRSSDAYMAAYTKELTRLGVTPRGDALRARDETLTNMGL